MIALPCVGLIIFIQIKKITVQTVFAPFDMTDFYLSAQEWRRAEDEIGIKRDSVHQIKTGQAQGPQTALQPQVYSL